MMARLFRSKTPAAPYFLVSQWICARYFLGMRLFLALPLTLSDRTQLGRLRDEAAVTFARGWRALPFESWHVTIQFLGSLDANKKVAVEKWLRNTQPVRLPPLQWTRWHSFPSPEAATVLAVTGAISPQWTRWVDTIRHELGLFGIENPAQPFIAHATLFRRKEPQIIGDIPKLKEEITFTPRSICLYQSRLEPTGATHRVIVDKKLS